MVTRFIPSADSYVDRALSFLGFTPLFQFFPQYHPRLHAIHLAAQVHLQRGIQNNQLLENYFQLLLDMHQTSSVFPILDQANIQQRFFQNWPDLRPLDKTKCLTLWPASISWGMVDRAINEPILWINSWLVQALEAAREGTDLEIYLQFLTIVTILHEAAHLLVGLVSPGHATPPDIGTSTGDAGFQFERSLLGGIATVEISKFALFDVSKMQRLLLRSDGFFEIIDIQTCQAAVHRFLAHNALWTSPQLQRANLLPDDTRRFRLVSEET